jgi:glycosyltransferase involved in cell wall biosynthesis
MPKVSVVMNVLNGERFVRQAIQSVYDQTFRDWEILFWDNASTDKTAEIAKSFDGRLRYFRSVETVPLGEARRRAMQHAQGEWIAFVDHDDICVPHRFERQLTTVGNSDFVLCYGGMREINFNGKRLRDVLPRHRSGDAFAPLLTHFEANLQTSMLRRSVLERYHLEFDPTYTMFEDFNLFMRLAAKGPTCVVPEVLCFCRVMSGSASDKSLANHARERFATLDQLRAENPGIERRYPRAFHDAEVRGYYYRARYEFESGRAADGRKTMRKIAGEAPVYAALYLLSFFPGLWRRAHKRGTKTRLTGWLINLIHRRAGPAAS